MHILRIYFFKLVKSPFSFPLEFPVCPRLAQRWSNSLHPWHTEGTYTLKASILGSVYKSCIFENVFINLPSYFCLLDILMGSRWCTTKVQHFFELPRYCGNIWILRGGPSLCSLVENYTLEPNGAAQTAITLARVATMGKHRCKTVSEKKGA